MAKYTGIQSKRKPRRGWGDARPGLVSNHCIVFSGPLAVDLAGQPPVQYNHVGGGAACSVSWSYRARERAIRSGDSVVAIGYPYHGLLTSDFTVTTGIVSSLSGLLNDTRFLQISAAVQPGNSGGPLIDTSGQIVGMVAAKINALKFVRATGNIPENINFAIKTGAIRDFLDNSVVPYQIAEPKGELKTAEIAGNARAYTLLISCTGTEQTDAKK